MKRRTKALVSGAVAVPVVLGVSGSAYGFYYRDRALPGSSVAGMDVAGKTRDEVAAALRQRADQVEITLALPDGTKTASLADLGTIVDIDATVDRVFAANRDWKSYAEAVLEARSVEAVVSTDAATRKAYLTQLGRAYARPAQNATVALGSDGTTFAVTPAKSGRSLAAPELDEAVASAARRLSSAQASADVREQAPAVSTAAGQAVAKAANAIVAAPVRIKDGTQTFTASARDKASWVQLPTTAGERPEVAKDRIAAWVATQAKSVNTNPTNGVRYVTSAGKVARVVTDASDGRRVKNADAVANTLTRALNDGQGKTTAFITKTVPATWTERTIAAGAENLAYPAASGEKWIDVNLSRHTMTAYVGGKAVLGPVLMVNGAPATPTDVGTFQIYWKNPLMTMRGQNADGSDYETPNVPWSSFFNGGEALHGAYWRDSFGYAASHGCVNLPISTAKWIYDWAPVGTPVVSHH